MTKKQLKKVKRAKLLKKKHNQEKNSSKPTKLTPERLMNEIMNSDPNSIHEDDFIAHDCSLCGKEVTDMHDSHNAYPLKSHTTAKQVIGKAENDQIGKGEPSQGKVIAIPQYLIKPAPFCIGHCA